MKPGDTIKRTGEPYVWAPIGFITKCCIDPNAPNPELIDITKPYGSLGYICLDGSFVFIYGDSWEVIEGEPPEYGKGNDYSAPDIVVPNNVGIGVVDIPLSAEQVTQAAQLYKIVTKFRDKQKIYHPEVVYTWDHVAENSYEFMAELMSVVGYLGWPASEED